MRDCVCVREREGERERVGERGREREGEIFCYFEYLFLYSITGRIYLLIAI
jgi:hypothetical protein